jgi:drug/metabolite transporter (DMT)-like permease
VWGLLAAIVLVPTFAAVVLYLEGIKRLGPSQAAIVSMFEPLFAIMLSWALLGERLVPVQLVGAAVVLSGVVLSEWGEGGKVEEAAVV